jgi:hypothetical protein
METTEKNISKNEVLNFCQYKNIPLDFDPKEYKLINKDLRKLTDLEATLHYDVRGHREKNRKYKLNRNLNFNVYVYCSGKSGSMTLYQTFLKNGFYPLHVHGFSYFLEHVPESVLNPNLFNVIEQSMENNEQIYIIDSYRTPVERKISSFFQNYHGNMSDSKENIESVFQQLDDKIVDLENYDAINEIMSYFKLPLFSVFDFNKRYNLLQHKNITFIKLLFSDIKHWDTILSEIFGKKIVLESENFSDDKQYKHLYNIVKESYHIPACMINNVKESKSFQMYNTKEDQTKYLEFWSKRTK